ncbi:MAG: hypothetical protein WBB18_05360 [Nodosilinea sp.]
MKRFILCSLSATVALALGTAVQAETVSNNANAKDHNQAGESRFEYRNESLTRGILSPDSQGPNNRALPDGIMTGLERYEANRPSRHGASLGSMPDSQSRDTNALPGVVSPDSQGPNNRAVPDRGMTPSGEGMAPSRGTADSQNSPAPTEGILSPDSQGPNNRAVPGQ